MYLCLSGFVVKEVHRADNTPLKPATTQKKKSGRAAVKAKSKSFYNIFTFSTFCNYMKLEQINCHYSLKVINHEIDIEL